jgi:hypothetical protein
MEEEKKDKEIPVEEQLRREVQKKLAEKMQRASAEIEAILEREGLMLSIEQNITIIPRQRQ